MAQNLHLIEVKYSLPTSTSKAKLKFTSLLFDGDTFTVDADNKLGTIKDQALEIFKAAEFKVLGYGSDQKRNVYIFASTIFDIIKPIKNVAKTLGENPFKSLKATAQRPTNQKPTKKYKQCI